MQTLTKLVPVHLAANHLAALERIQSRLETNNRSDTIRRIIELVDAEKPRKTKAKQPISEKSENL